MFQVVLVKRVPFVSNVVFLAYISFAVKHPGTLLGFWNLYKLFRDSKEPKANTQGIQNDS